MSQDIRDFVNSSVDVLAFGEPTHQEPAFARVRNDLFAQLAGLGFRSIAMETDRVAALAVNAYVQEGAGTLDEVMGSGFTHGFGELDANRQLITWMREYNADRPAADRLAFHGFDAQMETISAPSPRPYLEHARDYLGRDDDIAGIAGDDELWSRTEAVMDYAQSPGAGPEAARLRCLADDMLVWLYSHAPKLIATTSRTAWLNAEVHLTAGLGLLRYHAQCAKPVDPMPARVSELGAVRDALMAQNLLSLRRTESSRGGTMLFAHNKHLQASENTLDMWDMELSWAPAGAIFAAVSDEQYTFVAGSLGHSDTIALDAPPAGTYEAHLQPMFETWGLCAPTLPALQVRTDTTPPQGYFPLDQPTLDDAAALLHIP
ncbi:erythromycin esterase family protein [Amycolatopsis magusensis]|uniref:erythromycin esterase family protein n=1 Tax=Amycolatopsis magusensis TaxID=882444 RepID=UPI003788AEB0